MGTLGEVSGGQTPAGGQPVEPWPSNIVDPSFLSIGIRAEGVGLGPGSLEKSQQAPLGVQARVLKTWGPSQTHMDAPRAHLPGSGALARGGRSGRPSPGRNFHSWPRGLWLILEPFWASVSTPAKEGKGP